MNKDCKNIAMLYENAMQQPTMTVDEGGAKTWKLNGKLHREDGPAVEYANGTKAWWLHDMRHREDGPAVEYANGDKHWYLNNNQYEDAFAWNKALLKLKGINDASENEINDKDDAVKETIAQRLKITEFPFVIKDKSNNQIYYENSKGYWFKREYDEKGNEIHFENSSGFWTKSEYDEKGNLTYYENSSGFWTKKEYDDKGNIVYYEDSYKNSTNIVDGHPAIIEMTFKEIADKLGIDAKNLRIKE